MKRRVGVTLTAGLVLVAAAGVAVAKPAPACSQVLDPRGDVVFLERVKTPVANISQDRIGGWTADPLDILSASVAVSPDRQYLTTTLHVVGISNDPVRGNVWRVHLQPDVTRARESIETIVRRVTGGDTFQIFHEYMEGQSALGGPGMWSDSIETTGSIDVARGLVQVRIPLTLLDSWHIKRNARLWGIQGQARSALGLIVHGNDWSTMNEGDAWDQTANANPHTRLDTPGCPLPA